MSVLVAGVGNVFLGDDGFGVEVVRRLDPAAIPEGVEVVDYGIRGVHLAYELLAARYDALILIDAVPLGEVTPGTVALIDATGQSTDVLPSTVDAHSMSPAVVLGTLHGLGGSIDRVLVVGCQPQVLEEEIGLSEPVAAAVDEAVRVVIEAAGKEAARVRVPAGTHDGEEG